jgi:hypothetical protein
MMAIRLQLGLFKSQVGQERHDSQKALLYILEALTRINQLHMQQRPHLPDLYDAGVIYQREDQTEDWKDIIQCLRDRHGDCEDLSAWRSAELRSRHGIPAKCFLTWRMIGSVYLYHVQVEYPDGKIEDPSRLLGMEG